MGTIAIRSFWYSLLFGVGEFLVSGPTVETSSTSVEELEAFGCPDNVG